MYKDEEGKKGVVAIHDQWVWGITAVKYTKHLINILRKTDLGNMILETDIDDYIKSILSVRWHKNKKYFYHNVNICDMDYSPDRADTNHGCCILDITDLKNFKCSFFDSDGKFMPLEKFAFDYENEDYFDEIKDKLLPEYKDKAFDKLTEKDYQDLCEYMRELVKEKVVKRLED